MESNVVKVDKYCKTSNVDRTLAASYVDFRTIEQWCVPRQFDWTPIRKFGFICHDHSEFIHSPMAR